MALPKISYPIYELILPSSKEKISFRPFLVKEEKILLTAQVGDEPSEILTAVRQVINNCILSEGVTVSDLSTFDLEYLFIKIRSKSVNNIITLTYKDAEDDLKYTVEVDLDQVQIVEDPNHVNKIEITKDTGMVMKYPKADISNTIKVLNSELDIFFEVLKNSIDFIYDSDKIYKTADYTEEELEEFIQSLDVNTFKKIQDFYNTMPKLFYEVKYVNSLGNERVIPLTTLNDFFTLG